MLPGGRGHRSRVWEASKKRPLPSFETTRSRISSFRSTTSTSRRPKVESERDLVSREAICSLTLRKRISEALQMQTQARELDRRRRTRGYQLRSSIQRSTRGLASQALQRTFGQSLTLEHSPRSRPSELRSRVKGSSTWEAQASRWRVTQRITRRRAWAPPRSGIDLTWQ